MTDAAGPLGWINYWKPKDEWHYLPAERRQTLLAAWSAIRDDAVAAGARHLGTYECRASTAWARASLWEFPDLATLTSMVDALSDAAYYQYFAEENAFGRRTEEPYANYLAAADATESFTGGA
jgi:hypothetical protein